MTSPGTRTLLVVSVASAVAAGAVLFAAAAMALSTSGRASPVALAGIGLIVVAFVVLGASSMLVRRVAGPVERIVRAARELQEASPPGLPILGDSGLGLDQAALAFERTAAALAEERERLAAKVAELTRTNLALAEARESLIRSEKLATVGRLAAGVAHEVGNPLGAVAGYAEVALARLGADADPGIRDALDRIVAAAARIDQIVRELLDFARPVPGESVAVALAAPLESALRLAAVQRRFRGVSVSLEIPSDLPRVRADERRLSQAFLNLLLNAGDATEGAGVVAVVAREEGEWVVLDVADDGPGIPAADTSRVFDPFYTTKDPGKGTGLGLAIVHRAMEDMGGSVEVVPSAVGACFRIRLRRAP
jgi:signal transduction histidine kinase